MKIDLSVTVDTPQFEGLQSLGGVVAGGLNGLEGAARKIRVLVPESFEGRQGYQSDFLAGWTILLPKSVGARADDVPRLRRKPQSLELYGHFSTAQSNSFQTSIHEVEEKTSLSLGALSRFDEFSITESKTGKSSRAEPESLDAARI
jgi:hypothetical protein